MQPHMGSKAFALMLFGWRAFDLRANVDKVHWVQKRLTEHSIKGMKHKPSEGLVSYLVQHSQLQTCTMGALVLLRWWVSQTRGIIASAKQMLDPQSLKEYLALKGWIVWKTTSF